MSHARSPLVLLAALALGGFVSLAAPRAAAEALRWHVVETANLRVLNYAPHAVERATAERCEQLRERLVRRWLGDAEAFTPWSPKCDIVLHPSDASYVREVGSGGRSTVASALVDRRSGRVVLRRIDVRATEPDWQSRALCHELTHVVLADRFPDQAVPRWADEGAAILADSADKRKRHRRDLKHALSRQAEFRLLELVALEDYPPQGRWGTFYGQSASLVEYLVDHHGGEEQFLEFLDLSFEQGYERASRHVYQLGMLEIEKQWREHLRRPSATRQEGATQASLPHGQAGSPHVDPVSLHAR